MIKKLTLIFFLTAFRVICYPQNDRLSFDYNNWHNYEFNINNIPFNMSLYLYENKVVTGCYYENCQKKIILNGTEKNGTAYLTCYYRNELYGYLTVNVFVDTLIYFSGTWSDSARLKTIHVDSILKKNSITSSPYHRYTFGRSVKDLPNYLDGELEKFAIDLKAAVTSGNKIWLAKHISYPIKFQQNKKWISYNNEQEFLKGYSRIFTQDDIAYYSNLCPYDLNQFPKCVTWGDFCIDYIPKPTGGYSSHFIIINYFD